MPAHEFGATRVEAVGMVVDRGAGWLFLGGHRVRYRPNTRPARLLGGHRAESPIGCSADARASTILKDYWESAANELLWC
jgi:hypothetical protein